MAKLRADVHVTEDLKKDWVLDPTQDLLPASKRSLDLLRFIWCFREAHGFMPSLREMAEGLGVSSTNGVRWHLRGLTALGYLSHTHRGLSRAFTLTALGAAMAQSHANPDPAPVINLVGFKDAIAKKMAEGVHEDAKELYQRASARFRQAQEAYSHLPDDIAVGIELLALDRVVAKLREDYRELAKQTSPAWLKLGSRVFYRFSRLQEPLLATVDSLPWQLNDGTWVVRLRDLPKDYKDGKRRLVAAAALDCITPAVEDKP